MKDNYFCRCGHRRSRHENMIETTIQEYNARAGKEIRHELQWYLDTIKTEQLEWLCRGKTKEQDEVYCRCNMYVLDNLKYLEAKAHERELNLL